LHAPLGLKETGTSGAALDQPFVRRREHLFRVGRWANRRHAIRACAVSIPPPASGSGLGCAGLGVPPCRPPAGYRMTTLLADYLPLVIFIGVSLLIAAALLIAPFVVAYKQPDPEKLSAYECGFNAFDDARMKFDVRFYLVAILFIIFDLEVAFLFPWAITFGGLGWYGFWSMMIFLAVLTVGFIYEWKKGALEWD
jgi:NADH-quinone oxidoreductase subunit A